MPAFRKLEVYKAAVESALETGVVDAREHEMLRRLCLKLGLHPEDAGAVEAEVATMRQGLVGEDEPRRFGSTSMPQTGSFIVPPPRTAMPSPR